MISWDWRNTRRSKDSFAGKDELRKHRPHLTTTGRGFTLIELLVGLGIIAILLAILLPSVGKARRQARLTNCASNLRQIVMAMNSYAARHNGIYPMVDMPGTGANMWDVPIFYTDEVLKEGVDLRTFYCPAVLDTTFSPSSWDYYGNFRIVGYNVWVERKNGADLIPPSNTYSGTRMKIVEPRPAEPFAGPRGTSDLRGLKNPVITDIVGSTGVTPPGDARLDSSNPYNMSSSHMNGPTMLGVNQGYSDGHVEMRGPQQVAPYYFGNHWNWR